METQKPAHEVDPAAGRNEWEERERQKMEEEVAAAKPATKTEHPISTKKK